MLGLQHLRELRHAPLDFYRSVHRKQGDIVTVNLGPYRLRLLFHPREIEAVLTTCSANFVRFERVMKILAQWNGQSLLILEGQEWHARRRHVLPAFARRRMQDYALCSIKVAERLALKWQGQCEGDVVHVDADHEMARLALDIALDSLFGTQADDFREDIAEAVAVFSHVAYSETAGLFRTPSWWPFGIGPRKSRAIKTVDDFVRDLIKIRKATDNGRDRGDLLSMLLLGDEREARDDAVTLLIAGHETSGAALGWLAYSLSSHPQTLQAVLQEVDAVLKDRTATSDDFDRLKILRAAVSEVLRLYPPAYGLFPRRAVCDVIAGSADIRRNDIILLSPFVTQRDPRFFKDPECFRPERFLSEPEWPAYAYFPFGAGPRVCIGQQFGLVEITLAMATLLRRFVPLPVAGPVELDAKFSLRPKGGLPQTWMLR